MKLSVLVCTRNRAKSLDRTIDSIFAQHFEGDYEFEVIVVDNGSLDETEEVVSRWSATYPGVVNFCREPEKGLSRARNTAISSASGDVAVFTDDDVLVSENWLDEVFREFCKDSELYLLGGRVLLAREDLQRVAFQPSEERQTFTYPESGSFVMGANMAFRKELFNHIGLFDVRLGAGRYFAGAEEADIFYRALNAGYKVLYAPNVLVYHDHDRFEVEQACQLEYGYGKGCSAYLVKHALGGDSYAVRMVYWLVYRLPERWLKRNADSDDILRRRRAQIKGIVVGLLTAPFVMWGRGR